MYYLKALVIGAVVAFVLAAPGSTGQVALAATAPAVVLAADRQWDDGKS